MAQFHPDIHWLVDYSSGTLPLANTLCVSAHLEYCPRCRQRVAELNALGGALLKADSSPPSQQEQTEVSGSLLDAVFDKIDALDSDGDDAQPVTATPKRPPTLTDSGAAQLPRCLHSLLPGGVDKLDWRKLGASLNVARLGAGDPQREVSLHRMKAGGGVANHDHRGLEVTVVLQGSFSDQRGLYLPGDFLVMDSGDRHRPQASEDMDCLCLSAVEAPIRFTGPVARVLNPFLKIRPGI